ncbi:MULTISPECIES: DUF924 family protein [Novosphingobium]|uniref:DUF924 family protein n=1 Tax=Novosphingobium sp. ST904 TaxID=1684385 RepID=UPI0006C84B4A|nr:DUF924 family protein [Novosphingobium sp. ST904]KPH65341.1 hypothetical protein ADT71_10720 [Novosphingobium sp. ST904]TCM30720.1 uncharacterized protein (DUF924 family) [Novosphingobium sp. ST904]
MGRLQDEVLDFWFRQLTPQDWFVGGERLDSVVRARFGALHRDASGGALDRWADDARGRLALILVLDQFSRHIHRGTAQAFASDDKALSLALDGIAAGMDERLSPGQRQFFYMPLMHSEDPAIQARSIERFTALRDFADRNLAFARSHAAEIARFGRFPGRNAALGREPDTDEDAFLSEAALSPQEGAG